MNEKYVSTKIHIYVDIMQRNRVVLVLVTVAFLLRMWGIWNVDSGDENNEIFEALRVCSGQLNYERWFKRFYLYVLAFEYGVFYVVGWIFQWFVSTYDFAEKIIRDMKPLYIIARTTSAMAGTLSVFMTYLIGCRLYGRNAGMIAALFLCFNVVNVELSHYARVDATLCAMVLIAFYFIVVMYLDENKYQSRYYALAGLFMGVAFQNKAPAIILFIPFIYSHVARHDFRISLQTMVNRQTSLMAIFFIFGLIIGNPAILFAPLKFLQGMIATGDAYTTPINETRSEYIGYLSYSIYFFRELGVPLGILAIYSFVRAVSGRQQKDILLLSFIIPFYMLMGASRYMVGFSYMIPLMPFLYLLCSRYLIEGLARYTNDSVQSRRMLCGILVILLIYPVYNVGRLLLSFSQENTRYIAKYWIERNIPIGSKILMDSGKTVNSTAPLIDQNRESILRTISEIEETIASGTLRDPTKMVDQNAIKYYQMLLKSVPDVSYDITSTKFGLELKSIDYYKAQHYKYFIISDSMKRARSNEYTSGRYPEVASFYSSLDTDKRVQLIKIISPTATNSGETYLIYKIL